MDQASKNMPNLSALEVTADNFVEIFKNQDEQVQKLNHKCLSLETQIEALKAVIQSLELQKSEIDVEALFEKTMEYSKNCALTVKNFSADITKLRLRNIAYQKEHSNLRNSITVVKFHIEKIKESIAKAKAVDLKNLEEFEKAVDEITEKFRTGPNIYDRKILMESIEREKEKKNNLTEKLDEVKNLYETFCNEKGLRVRKDENDELLNCILPGTELSYLMEMTKTLDDVICGIQKLTKV